jgi:hypothetical protein
MERESFDSTGWAWEPTQRTLARNAALTKGGDTDAFRRITQLAFFAVLLVHNLHES